MTTAQTIIDAAINSALANDDGASRIASDETEILAVLSRIVRQVYILAGTPAAENGWGSGAYFTRSRTLTVGTPSTTPVVFGTPEVVRLLSVVDATGNRVAVVKPKDLALGRGEFPPAIVLTDGAWRSAARAGDPAAGAALTAEVAYMPPAMTLTSHFIGATIPADSSTSGWPDAVGDPFLIDALRLYFATKDDARREVAEIAQSLAGNGELLATVLGINKAPLSRVLAE